MPVPAPAPARISVAAAVATLLGVAYFCAAASINLALTLAPAQFAGDHAQAVAHYWRYHVDGAMPAGDLLTDYAFLMHAPIGWWAPMALLSTFLTPLAAAKVLSVVAYVVTGALAWLIVFRSTRNNFYVAAAALVLVARCQDCHYFLAGGYARSFGPALVLLFVLAWAFWSHRAVLLVLILQAALYPSVVVACGLAYGTYCVLAVAAGQLGAASQLRLRVRLRLRLQLRRCATLALAGVVIIGLGMMQELRAPKEWGAVVWLEDALKMPAWGRGGRIQEAPLQPISLEVNRNLVRAFTTTGHVPVRLLARSLDTRLPWNGSQIAHFFVGVWFGLFLLVVARRIWRGPAYGFHVPWQMPALFVAAFVGYLLARALAFKLYLPYRVLAHSWVWLILLVVPLVAYELGLWMASRKRATAIAVVLSLAPTLFLLGDGLAVVPGIYPNSAANREHLHAWVKKKTPLDAFFAGDLGSMDKIPLFTHRQVLVNRVLAHPFRPGFYALVDERIRETYAALYANDPAALIAFGKKWSVDYVLYHHEIVTRVDRRLFEPIKRDVARLFRANKARGPFAIETVPASAVVYRKGPLRVIDLAKLEAASSAGEANEPVDEPVNELNEEEDVDAEPESKLD